MTKLAVSLPLPAGFRYGDILSFHRRDAHELAERVGESSLEKGLIWRGLPARLSIRFQADLAEATLSIDGRRQGKASFESMVRRMLGLDQDIEAFETRFRRHPQIGKLTAQRPGLRVPVSPTPFEALTWAIVGQQISVAAAVSIRRKLILAAGIRHSSGLLCYPGAAEIVRLDESALRGAGFSVAKAATILTLSRMVAADALPLDRWVQGRTPVEVMRKQLEQVRGIGPWTVNYTLLRGFGYLDGSLHGDVAVRRGLQILLGAPSSISEKDAQRWLSQFSPWRALVGAHLWAAKSPGNAHSY